MRRNPSAIVEKWISEKAITDQFAVTSISIAEICRGIYRLPNGNRRNRLEKNFNSLLSEGFQNRIFSFDKNAAYFFGFLTSQREKDGLGIDTTDLMIAGIAAYRECSIATRNESDFSGLGIEVLNPWLQ